MNRLLLIPIFLTIVLSGCTTQYSTPTTTSTSSQQTSSSSVTSSISTTSSSSASTASVTIQNFAFVPNSLTVGVGTTVTWTNQDSPTHTIVSDSGNELNSGSIAPGQSFSHTFTQAGTYAYHCSIHPSMKATVIVQ